MHMAPVHQSPTATPASVTSQPIHEFLARRPYHSFFNGVASSFLSKGRVQIYPPTHKEWCNFIIMRLKSKRTVSLHHTKYFLLFLVVYRFYFSQIHWRWKRNWWWWRRDLRLSCGYLVRKPHILENGIAKYSSINRRGRIIQNFIKYNANIFWYSFEVIIKICANYINPE